MARGGRDERDGTEKGREERERKEERVGGQVKDDTEGKRSWAG